MTTSPETPAPTAFWRPTLAAGGALIVASISSFLLGAFAPEIKQDLGIGDTGIGLIFTLGFVVSAIVLQLGGGLADRHGPRKIMRIGIAVGAIGLLCMASLATSALLVMMSFALNRTAEGLTQPASNTLMSQGVIATRRGTATGIKQAAIPLATVLAGLSVPLLGDLIGWRWSFGVFAAAAVITVGGFLVSSARAAGYSKGQAGLLLALGGLVMIPSRLAWGILADRRSFDKFRAVSACLAISTIAFLLFSTETRLGILVGTVLMFGIGWSWPGLFLFAVLEQHPEAPGASTAIVQTGVRIGAMFSPITFGWLADTRGFGFAWLVPGASAMVAALLLLRVSAAVARPQRDGSKSGTVLR